MMKAARFSALAWMLLCAGAAHGQPSSADRTKRGYSGRNNGTYGRDIRLASVGYGFPPRLAPVNDPGTAAGPRIGPVVGRFEFSFREEAGIGALVQVGLEVRKYGRFRDVAVGVALGSAMYYHFNKIITAPRLDVYCFGGFGVAYRYLNYDYRVSSAPSLTAILLRPLGGAGIRYYLGPRMGLYAEGGALGLCYGHAGLTMRMQE